LRARWVRLGPAQLFRCLPARLVRDGLLPLIAAVQVHGRGPGRGVPHPLPEIRARVRREHVAGMARVVKVRLPKTTSLLDWHILLNGYSSRKASLENLRDPRAAGLITLGCVGFEPYGAEVVPGGQPHIGVKGGGQLPEQGDGGFGAAFFNALDVIYGHVRPVG
jgi:hypothetical protein